ncbi:hypothetical protein [Nocardia testacea]|uniref:hypothetical protein n=1 Tax=Nocardia testacea TaxID=248551 RepID=UPI00031DD2D5|nr:hypothetical protein [Nocardia testacea]
MTRRATGLPRHQRRAYHGVWLWLRRRTDCDGRERQPLPGTRGVLALPLAFLAATLLEMAVLHILIPWAWLSISLGVLSLWSLLLLFAVFVADIAYPHYATDRALVLRRGGREIAVIAFDRIAAVTEHRRYNHTGTALDSGRLFLAGPDGTTVDVTLHEPVDVRVRSPLPSGRIAAAVTRISLFLDHPEQLRGIRTRPGV